MAHSATLSLNTVDYPFETLVHRVTSDPPKLILDPEFQRKYKWDKEGWSRASKFIESCLMRIPLPSCYFAETKDGRQLVIDGVQRITTILRFFNDEFALEDMSAFPELEGKRFSQIGTLKAELESTTIRCIILRKENPPDLIAEIFSRLNQGSVALSDQEIRHALYAGEFDKLLQELSQIPTIEKFGMRKDGRGAPKDSREGEELVLRFFAFHESASSYEGNLSKFLDNYMRRAATYDASKLDDLKGTFEESLEACQIIFNEDEIFSDISSARRRQGVIYFDLLMNTLGRINHETLQAKREDIRAAFRELASSPQFKSLLAGGVQRKTSINRRNEMWNERLKAVVSA